MSKADILLAKWGIRTQRPRRGTVLASLALLLASLSGCGDDVYQKAVVTGRVTCGDTPAWGGVVTFQPIDLPEKTGRPAGNPGGVSRGQVEKDGTFRLTYEARGTDSEQDGAIIGPHRVTWIPPMTEPMKWSKQDDWLPEDQKAKLKAELANEPVYPKLVCGNEITPAEVEVKTGPNEFTFQLQAAAKSSPAAQRPTGSD